MRDVAAALVIEDDAFAIIFDFEQLDRLHGIASRQFGSEGDGCSTDYQDGRVGDSTNKHRVWLREWVGGFIRRWRQMRLPKVKRMFRLTGVKSAGKRRP